jgi:hypothetical protein
MWSLDAGSLGQLRRVARGVWVGSTMQWSVSTMRVGCAGDGAGLWTVDSLSNYMPNHDHLPQRPATLARAEEYRSMTPRLEQIRAATRVMVYPSAVMTFPTPARTAPPFPTHPAASLFPRRPRRPSSSSSSRPTLSLRKAGYPRSSSLQSREAHP